MRALVDAVEIADYQFGYDVDPNGVPSFRAKAILAGSKALSPQSVVA